MTQPVADGPLFDLIQTPDLLDEDFKAWHYYLVKSVGGPAGRWAIKCLRGRWTFRADFGHTHFYIKDDSDAAFFKLTWSDYFA
jgi:hypothetical protein